MLWNKKPLADIRQQLSQLSEQAGSLREDLSAGMQKNTADISGQLEAAREAIGRHDLAIEDMLEAWEEIQEDARNQTDRLKSACEKLESQQNSELGRQTEALLQLIIAGQDQLFALHRAAEQDAAWKRQFELAETKLHTQGLLAGFQMIGQPGDTFAYELHEAVSVLETDDPALSLRLAEVYTPGYVYRGQVLRKAEAAVYQHRNTEQTEERP